MEYAPNFIELVAAFTRHNTDFANIFPASVAQFILESARGTSLLAKDFNNFAGMKWRPEMAPVATKELVEAPSETAFFCKFKSIEDFVKGYWVFLGRSPYDGWEAHAVDAFRFIDFIAPIWAADPAYSEKLKDLLGEAEALIGLASRRVDESITEDSAPTCEGMSDVESFVALEVRSGKPAVQWDPSPFNWSRDGTAIDTIVMHYTTSRSLSGTVSWFKDPNNTKKTAAHYVIGRDGTIVQMVKDKDACTHGNSQNRRSVGIEHSAAAGDKMTAKQTESSAALVRWLMGEYSIARTRVIGHKCAPRSTSCPGDLFKDYGATSSSNCSVVTTAIQSWLDDHVV